MKNFSIITTLRLGLLRHCRLPDYRFSEIRLSEILHEENTFRIIPDIKPHTCSFEENEKKTAAGTYFEKKLKFELSRLRPEVSEFLNRYTGNQVVAIVTDANGYSWLIYPLVRTIKRLLPGTAKGANLTEVEFFGQSLYDSPAIQIDL